jgi:hypothetical protein
VDWNLVEAAGKYAGLAGVALIVFLWLMKSVLNLMKPVGGKGAISIINNVINKVFWVTVLALVAWLAVSLFGQAASTNSVLTSPNVELKDLSPDVLTPVAGSAADALKARDSLTLKGSTLTIGQPGENRTVTIACNTLRLMNGARIITNGNHLVIQALKVEFANNTGINSFAPDNAKAAPGAPGADGGSVSITALKNFSGSLRILLPGQGGGDGSVGAQGAQGTTGGPGADAVKGLFDCRSGGQNGGGGGPGGKGGTGANGAKGGNGGTLALDGEAAKHKNDIDFRAPGGLGGKGGAGGPSGPGGPGGPGGSGDGLCSGGHPGGTGLVGSVGDIGQPGANGRDGH